MGGSLKAQQQSTADKVVTVFVRWILYQGLFVELLCSAGVLE